MLQNKNMLLQRAKRITAFVLLFLFLFQAGVVVQAVESSSIPEDELVWDGKQIVQYQTEPDYYELDTRTDGGVVDGYAILNSMLNGIWSVSRLISSFTGEMVQEAYELDFIKSFSDKIGQNIQGLIGIRDGELTENGLIYGFLLPVILIMGLYVAYQGLIKRQTSRAISALTSFLTILVFSVGILASAPTVISKLAEFSAEVNRSVLGVCTEIVLGEDVVMEDVPETIEGEDGKENAGFDNSAEMIGRNIFDIQVHKPWLILQFGTIDVPQERMNAILLTAPGTDERAIAVANDITEYGNRHMTIEGFGFKFGYTMLVVICNLVMSAFILFLLGMMLFSQLHFILFAYVIPFIVIFSLLPNAGGKLINATMELFNLLLARTGISVIMTIAFTLSSLLYTLAGTRSFLFIIAMQILVYVGTYVSMPRILRMIGIDVGSSNNMAKNAVNRMKRMPRQIQRGAKTLAMGAAAVTGLGALSRVKKRKAQGQNSPKGAESGKPLERANKKSGKNTSATGAGTDTKKEPLGKRAGAAVGTAVGTVQDLGKRMKDNARYAKEGVKNTPMNAKYAMHQGRQAVTQSAVDFKDNFVSQKAENRMEKVRNRTEKKDAQAQRNAVRRAELEQAKKEKSQRKLDKRENKGEHEEMSRPAYSQREYEREKQSRTKGDKIVNNSPRNDSVERTNAENKGNAETRSSIDRKQYRRADSPESRVRLSGKVVSKGKIRHTEAVGARGHTR